MFVFFGYRCGFVGVVIECCGFLWEVDKGVLFLDEIDEFGMDE